MLLSHGGLFNFLYTRCCTCVIVVVFVESTEVMCECLFVPGGISETVVLCGFATLSSFFVRHEEVLEGAICGEAARIVQGGCTPGCEFVHQLTVSDYAIWFTNVLR